MNNLSRALSRMAQLQGETLDRLALHEAVQIAQHEESQEPQAQLQAVTRLLQINPAHWLRVPNAAAVPALLHAARGWGILRGANAHGQWMCEWFDTTSQRWEETTAPDLAHCQIARLRMAKPFQASKSAIFKLIKDELFSHKKALFDAALGGVVINSIALASSFYSMQVYDRVLPNGATQTLLVLTLGMGFAALFELMAKHVRRSLFESLLEQVDQHLSRAVYRHFMSIRLDQMPGSVGELAAQMRGYEMVRRFLTSITSELTVDAPFALFFLALIGIICGWLALIPTAFFVLSIVVSLYYRVQITQLASDATTASNRKTGLLVESIEGAETIKSGQGGWRMLSRWTKTNDEARDYEQRLRRIQENAQYLMTAFQQISYVVLVALGALLISKGELTMGALIACSILSARVLTAASMIPNQLVQWAHTKAALAGLDRLWAFPGDHHGCELSHLPIIIDGNYRFEDVVSRYDANKALEIMALTIRDGEKIGVMGPIGGGKTTFLRLLSGMHKPQEGRILLDDMDISKIFKPLLAQHVG